MAFLIGGANSAADTGYDIENSLRFNDDDAAILTYTPSGTSSDANKRKYTFSFWIKRGHITNEKGIINWGKQTGGDDFQLFFEADDTLRIFDYGDDFSGSAYNYHKITSRLFRDTSAWYHIILIVDTTDGTAGDRVKLYINGVRETSFGTSVDPDQNYAGFVGSADACDIGWAEDDSGKALDGYISEFHYIDGTAKAHTDFGEFDEDSGIWKPKKYTGGSYSTNGFFLEFKATGTSADASGKGADTSGEGNHLDDANLAATDQTTDTPTNNFCTLNPLDVGSDLRDNGSFAEGNCYLTNGDTSGQANQQRVRGTMAVANGKWYYEMQVKGNSAAIGALDIDVAHGTTTGNSMQIHYLQQGEFVYYNGSGAVTVTSGIDTYTDDDTVGFALDMDNLKAYCHKNGTWQNSGDPTSGATGTGAAPIVSGTELSPLALDDSSGSAGTSSWNFGNPPHSISSGNADANGYGNFEYAPPSGYYALCTKNLAEFG